MNDLERFSWEVNRQYKRSIVVEGDVLLSVVGTMGRTQEGDLGRKMREALPNAFLFGLTGTPIKRATKIAVLVKNPERIRAVVQHMVTHDQTKVEPNGFKAQVVVFVMVTNKLRTGFDAPILQMMYLDSR